MNGKTYNKFSEKNRKLLVKSLAKVTKNMQIISMNQIAALLVLPMAYFPNMISARAYVNWSNDDYLLNGVPDLGGFMRKRAMIDQRQGDVRANMIDGNRRKVSFDDFLKQFS